MPVYGNGNAWDRVKSILTGAINWFAGLFTKPPDPPDDPPTEE